jgi:hypothetical protein
MQKLAIFVSALALTVLAACTSYDTVRPAPVVVAPSVSGAAPAPVTASGAPVVTSGADASVLRLGNGVIESIAALPSAAAGATAGKPMQRVGVRMDDGSFQFLDTNAPGLTVGKRVQILKDGTMVH